LVVLIIGVIGPEYLPIQNSFVWNKTLAAPSDRSFSYAQDRLTTSLGLAAGWATAPPSIASLPASMVSF